MIREVGLRPPDMPFQIVPPAPPKKRCVTLAEIGMRLWKMRVDIDVDKFMRVPLVRSAGNYEAVLHLRVSTGTRDIAFRHQVVVPEGFEHAVLSSREVIVYRDRFQMPHAPQRIHEAIHVFGE